jgi:hypothetical protein
MSRLDAGTERFVHMHHASCSRVLFRVGAEYCRHRRVWQRTFGTLRGCMGTWSS